MTHTPTPWICDSDAIMPISRDGVSIVARIPNHPENKVNWEADAAFICRAVNSHDALVKALQEIAKDAPATEPDRGDYDFSNSGDVTDFGCDLEHYHFAKIARAALATLSHMDAVIASNGGE